MKKRLLLLIAAVTTMSYMGFAQCVPDVALTQPGIYPDTTTNLPQGTAGVFYSTDIQLKVLTDTFASGFNVDVVDITVNSVTGLPAGFTYSCTPSNCIFPGGSNGCIRLFGTENLPGTYNMTVNVTLNGLLFGSFPVAQPATITGYKVVLNAAPPAPVAAFSASTSTVCEGEVVTFTDLSTNTPDTWDWSFPGGTPSTSNLQNPVVTYSTPGTYDVTLNVSNITGGDGETTAAYINVNAKPDAKITPTQSIAICAGQSTTLTANAGAGYTYEWFNYSNVLAGQTGQSVSVSAAGQYKVKVTDTNTGCTKRSGIRTVTVNALPTVVVTPQGATTFCKDGSVNLFANSTATNIQWTKGGIDIPGATGSTYTAISSGFYKARGTSAQGCLKNSTGTAVTVLASPNAGITANGPLAFCQGDDVELSALFDAGNSYQWEMDLQPIVGATGNTYLANAAGKYAVFIEAANGCFRRSPVRKVEIICRQAMASLNENSNVSVLPNPNAGEAKIELVVAEKGNVAIDIFDITGRHQMAISNKMMDAGSYTIDMDMTSYPRGIYMIRMATGDKVVTTKMIIQ
jgi:large repetitive protein